MALHYIGSLEPGKVKLVSPSSTDASALFLYSSPLHNKQVCMTAAAAACELQRCVRCVCLFHEYNLFSPCCVFLPWSHGARHRISSQNIYQDLVESLCRPLTFAALVIPTLCHVFIAVWVYHTLLLIRCHRPQAVL